MKYRKKPVVIDAWPWPEIPEGAPVSVWEEGQGSYHMIRTREGVMTRSFGDWLIRGIIGEFYPCKPEVFDLTFEKA